ncbi:MAG: alpha-amylase family glycosyl hydrolase [Patescibacteria group bacterium]
MIDSKWGKRIIYQIYPRSFKDSNGDGIGDLPGIEEKLDYLKDLGVDAIWLSPVYRSPMHDFGYDISDYHDIDPIFGSLADFDTLVKKAHKMDMKVLMDFVPNHTSFEHPWFKESRSSKKNSKRDWYLWKLPKKNGEAPNNWLSQFGGSAWELDKKTGEYYLHTFDVSQPDLNWRNPKVVEEMLNVMRFWMRKGVDGFRVDVAYYLFKDPFFRDEPNNPGLTEHHTEYDSLLHIYTLALPETLNMLKKLNDVINEFEDRFMVCEIYTFLYEIVNLYQIVDHQSFVPFNFSFISLPWNAQQQKKFIDEFDEKVGEDYFPTYVLGNHDKPRIATKLGEKAARTAALLQLTFRGIPFIYYGEELGMENADVPVEKAKDPMAVNMKGLNFGRDPERSPMQWNTSKFGGFSSVEPWLPLGKEFKEKNVASEEKDKKSFLSLYKSLINLRKSRKSLSSGKQIPLDLKNLNVLGFIRREGEEKTLILANFSEDPQVVKLPKGNWTSLLSTHLDVEKREEKHQISLRSCEGIILSG